MIPKVVHYCWFGRGKKTELVIKCINSWKRILSDYEVKEWNEDNFDLDMYPYAREAYNSCKFAFVTDVVRLYVLYHEGGIYMDTDVEVVKSLDPFLHHCAFLGFESDEDISTGIMASEKGGLWVKENLNHYVGRHFIKKDGTLDITTNVIVVTDALFLHGLKRDNSYQDFPGFITIYPKDIFSPKSYTDGKIRLTENTVTIHHFAGSWGTFRDKMKKNVFRFIARNRVWYWLYQRTYKRMKRS